MFNVEEIKDLMSAIDSWEKDDGGELITTMIGGMLTPAEDRDSFLEERKAKSEEAAKEREGRKERAILLKARLIAMRDKAEAKEFGEAVTGDLTPG